jgi:hypothetical protein
MRCLAYEAVIPQQLEKPVRPQPYAMFEYKPDIDWLSGQFQHLDAAAFIELCEFMKPGLRVLDIGAAQYETLLNNLLSMHLTAAKTTAEDLDSFTIYLAPFKNTKAEKLDLTVALDKQAVELGAYDIVIARVSSPADLPWVPKLLAPHGNAILRKTSSLSHGKFKEAGLSKINVELKDNVVVATIATDSEPTESDNNHRVNNII